MKNLTYLLWSMSFCFASVSMAESQLVVRKDAFDESHYLVNAEETEITKEYVTALALDGLRRVFETGLEFLNKERSTISEIERKKKAIECGFKYALIDNDNDAWDHHYISCVRETGQITGDVQKDAANKGIYIAYRAKDTKDPKFYKESQKYTFYTNEYDYYPGPLTILTWAMDKIGKVAVDFSQCPAKDDSGKLVPQSDVQAELDFINNINAIIELMEARKRMGIKAYIAEMDKHFRAIQFILDSCAKSKVTHEVGIANLMNLRLTEEGASKLGQVAFEEVYRAYASRPITEENAKALALFALNNSKINDLLEKMQNGGDLNDELDEVIIAYNLIFEKYKEQIGTSQAPVRIAEKRKLAIATLTAYKWNDMHGYSKKKIEADPLKNAFKMGRILSDNAQTSEYNPAERSADRQEEQQERLDEFQKFKTLSPLPQLGSGEASSSSLKEESTKIQQ